LKNANTKIPFRILPIIVFSQFAGTSLWFAGNAILGDLRAQWTIGAGAVGGITSAVQLGFIFGTLCFAFFAISDRFSPRKIFFACSIFGALSNLLIFAIPQSLYPLLGLRFVVGFFLAGIYPIGMKIAAGWYQKKLGNAIGLLVGALVLGTAFPHLLKSIGGSLPWEEVIYSVSFVSAVGGFLMLWLVPDGPHITKGTKFDPKASYLVFKPKGFRSAAFGYFGHMWELYTFWAFVPVLLTAYATHASMHLNIHFWSFVIIGAGSLGCVIGGLISLKADSAKVAFTQLLSSGICCVLSPFLFSASPKFFIGFLIFWGIVVVGDSPQYSSISARTAPKELVGTGLTIMNSIGFAITIVSIQFVKQLSTMIDNNYLLVLLAVGPSLGLVSLKPLLRSNQTSHLN
jgi:MFS family permease